MNAMSTWSAKDKIILGIGNPGAAYENTYHCIGVNAVHFLSGKPANAFKNAPRKHFAYAKHGGIVFCVSGTYMNESGQAGREALAFFKKKKENLVVVHDDSDMEIGTWKLSRGQRSAGHHGIDSLITEIGSTDFYRIKIGIRPPAERVRKKAEEFVLKKIASRHMRLFEEMFDDIKRKLGI